MTNEALGKISDLLLSAGINYEFEEWTGEEIPSCYWVGEYTENESINEDGLHESSFILTGFTNETWLRLHEDKLKIEVLFPSIIGECFKLSNGSRLAVSYETAFPVPDNTMDIKKLQINLKIKEWMVN